MLGFVVGGVRVVASVMIIVNGVGGVGGVFRGRWWMLSLVLLYLFAFVLLSVFVL